MRNPTIYINGLMTKLSANGIVSIHSSSRSNWKLIKCQEQLSVFSTKDSVMGFKTVGSLLAARNAVVTTKQRHNQKTRD